MIQTYRDLVTKQVEAKETIETVLKATYPILRTATVYNPSNIFIESEIFAIDIYTNRTYTEADIKMVCKATASEIPTEEEAIQRVRAMHTEKAEFWKTAQEVIALMKKEDA